MKYFRYLFVMTVFVLLLAPVTTAAVKNVLILDDSIGWKDARDVIVKFGGRVEHVFPPSVMAGDIPDGAFDAIGKAVKDGNCLIFVSGEAMARDLLEKGIYGERTVPGLSFEAKAALNLLLPKKPVSLDNDIRFKLNRDGGYDILPPDAWEEPALIPEEGDLKAVGNSFYNTSDFQAGTVAIGIVRPESNGVVDPNTETWTALEVTNSYNELLAATAKIVAGNPNGNLTFVYRTEDYGAGVAGTVECNYEAVSRSNFDSTLVLNVLGNLGYTQSTAWNRMHEWVNDVRDTFGTDWAIGFFICDDSTAGTGRSSAYVGGPTVWEWGHTTSSVYHHEMGHSFSATDEYHPDAAQSPTGLHGYSQEVNANSQYNDGTGYFGGAGEGIDALQISNIEYVSPWERGQWCTWDLDGDGILEPQDTFPAITLNSPTGSPVLNFTGTANVTPLKKETGTWATADISVNTIANVEWRINGGPWQDAAASDGAFDESSETYSFSTHSLADGGFVIEARAVNSAGNYSQIYARRDATVTSSPTSNEVPMVSLSVTPELGSTATTFQFDASQSYDREDGPGLEYRWDYNNDAVWDTAYAPIPVTTWGFSAGSHTVAVEVRDMALNTATGTVDVTVSATNVPPTAMFTADTGMQFASSPVIFNFDASGVSDGEDPAAALQVRWDFEDDGIWDTSYSTTKTASNDYAMDYVANPIQESWSTWIWGGNSVTYYAQGFIAQTNGIGKVEIVIANNGDVTPGGTLTVGIRSSLTGGWLTSTTVNQADIIDSDWNTFDFANIPVTMGNTYYIVYYCSDGDIIWLADSANPYAGGSHWYSWDSANWYQSGTPYDHLFRVYDSSKSVVPLVKSKVWAVRMEVMDGTGLTSQAVRHVTANGYDAPPVAGAVIPTPASGNTSTNFSLTATATDVNSGAVWDSMVHYRWDVDNDGNFETEFSTTNTASKTYSRSGIYNATVEVRDRYHATDIGFVPIYVAPTLSSIALADRTDGSTTDTDEPLIEITLTTSGMPEEVMFSEDPGFSGAIWQNYRPVMEYMITGSPGPITVYARTRSGVGNESADRSDLITYTPSSGSAGEVDDNGTASFFIEKGSGTDLDLTWGTACNIGSVPGQTYAVYTGVIAQPWDWNTMVSVDCGVVGTSTTIGDPGPNMFFLVVPQSAGEEGSYGNGRPQAASPCNPQAAAPELCP